MNPTLVPKVALLSLMMILSTMAGCIFNEDDEERVEQLDAIFSYSPKTSIQVGMTVTFNASESYPQDGSLTYRWDFDGDGETDARKVETQTEFSSAGTHEVTLTVTDGLSEASSTKEVTVLDKDAVLPVSDPGSEKPDADCDGNEPPSKNQEYYLIYICEPDKDNGDRNTWQTTTVNLDGSASDPGSTNHFITSWEWDLNTYIDSDGNGIADDDVDETGETHEWKDVEIGEYEVQLTVTNNEGYSAATQVMVHVEYKGDWEGLHVNGNQTDGGELVFDTTFHYDREANNKIKRVDILLVYPTKDDDWAAGNPDHKMDIHAFNSTGEEVVNTTSMERNQGCSVDEDHTCITLQMTSYLIDTYEDGDWEIKIINGKFQDADGVEISIDIQYF